MVKRAVVQCPQCRCHISTVVGTLDGAWWLWCWVCGKDVQWRAVFPEAGRRSTPMTKKDA